jgi:hypothetical protein
MAATIKAIIWGVMAPERSSDDDISAYLRRGQPGLFELAFSSVVGCVVDSLTNFLQQEHEMPCEAGAL